MNLSHPLVFISPEKRKPLFLALLALTLAIVAVFRVLNAPLITSAAPGGIVTFEFAGDINKSTEILDSWNESANLYAAFGLGLDYLFMPVYALTLAMGALLAAGKHKEWNRSLGAAAGWMAIGAAVFDAIENFALWQILLGAMTQPWPGLAFVCATIKFTLILLSSIYGLVGWILPRRF
jgi:hypothetical protein